VGITDSIFHLVIGFVTGTVGIHYGAQYAGVESSWELAATTAFIGAVVWMVASIFMGWIPLIGSVGTFFVWLVAVKRLYSVSFGEAFEIAIMAWIVAFIVVHVESFLGFRNAEALGVPWE
jgi:maltodextrin utilization protein YvdJ